MFADALSHLLVAYMVLVWPWRGRRRYRTLQSAPDARIDVYRRMLLHQAVIVLVVRKSRFWNVRTATYWVRGDAARLRLSP